MAGNCIMAKAMVGMINGGMGIWTLLTMIFWILVIAGIAMLVLWAAKKDRISGHSISGKSILEILKKCYAREEIRKEEYEEKRLDTSQIEIEETAS